MDNPHPDPDNQRNSSTSFQDQVDEYAEKLRQRGCDPWCGAGVEAPPWDHRPICAVRILNPPPWNYDDWKLPQGHADGA
jgi:hypothetical protein